MLHCPASSSAAYQSVAITFNVEDSYPTSTGLREKCAGRHACTLGKTSLVNALCFSSADLQTLVIRPCFRCSDIATVVTQPYSIQTGRPVLVHRFLHGSAPEYLGLPTWLSDVPGQSTLRSASSNHLLVPPVHSSTAGARTIPVSGSAIGTVCRLASLSIN